MSPRSSDDEPIHKSRQHGPEAWSQHDLDLLHDMVRDYENARWFRRQAKWWGLWVLGVPAAALAFWEPVEKLLKKIGWH